MRNKEVYFGLCLTLLPLCGGAIAALPIKRTTIRFKFDDWQFYNEYAGVFLQPKVGNQHPLRRQDQSTYYHILYTTTIAIGTPPQPFTASIDLSWSDTFVPSVECLEDPVNAMYCREQNKYNSSISTTYQSSKTVTQLMYMGLSTSGCLAQDVLGVGGLKILNQQFEEATLWRSMYWDAAPLDSALGLARFHNRNPASNASTKSALRNMLDQNVLSRLVFSLSLPYRDHESGELTLGYSPSQALKSSAVILPLIEATPPKELNIVPYLTGRYTVGLESVTLRSSPRNNPGGRKSCKYKAILTNSFDYISLPGTLFTEIQTNLHPGLGLDDALADLHCSMREKLPNIVFSFGKNGVIVLMPWDYLTEVQDIETGIRCVLPFTQLEEFDDEWVVLGSAFMVGMHSTFDLEKGEVSLSILKK